VKHLSSTHSAKILDHKSAGLKKIWESIVGYSKRELMIDQGHLCLLEKKGGAFEVE